MSAIARLLDRLTALFKGIGALALTAMMLLTVADVVGRLFKHPIFGSVELVGFMAVVVTAAALPYTDRTDGHVGVEILVRLLPEKARRVIDLGTRILSLLLFSLIAWQMIRYTVDLKAAEEVSMNLEFPVYLVVCVLSVCLALFALTILRQMAEIIVQLRSSAPK